jgi:hypothetical protein
MFTGFARGSLRSPDSHFAEIAGKEVSLPLMPIRSEVRSSGGIAFAMTPLGAFLMRHSSCFRRNRGARCEGTEKKGTFDEAPRLNKYEMELSRGASHIGSMLYEKSMFAAVRETILEFEASHGRDDLMTFAHALLRRLEQRGKPAAAKVLQHFIECGRLPVEVPSAPPGLVSAPCPVVRKRKSTDSRQPKARRAA